MFITLEGPEGSGKTTQAERLVEWLRHQGRDVLAAREPGGTAISDAIRHILLDFRAEHVDPRTEVLLFCASRAQLVNERIIPHLTRGGMVVCDRFADSTLAYQGYGRGLDIKLLHSLLSFATYGITPDLTLLLDIDTEAGLRRKTHDEQWNRLDAETVDFHRRVRAGYLSLLAEEPERWVLIHAGRETEEVALTIQGVVSQALLTRTSE